MSAVVLTQAEVRDLLPMPECIDLMESAFRELGSGRAANPLRRVMRIPERDGLIGMMPGALPGVPAVGAKILAVFPENHGTRLDSHQGVVLLFDPKDGVPLAVMSASEITAIRTAATSGLATRLLARDDAHDLALLGSGVQARSHLEAMLAVRPVRRVRVHSLRMDACRAFAEREQARLGVPVEPVASAREALAGADLVVTATSSPTPVCEGGWLAPGAHVNAVGACFRTTRELDGAAVARARLFTDARESLRNESGDWLLAIEDGAIDADHPAAELGEVLVGKAPGRTGADEITLFKSLGLAIEDVAAAHLVLSRALERGVGARVDLEGRAEGSG